MVLAQYPRLVEGFVGFLEPDQAVEAGVVSLLMKLTTAYLTIIPLAVVGYEMVYLISNKCNCNNRFNKLPQNAENYFAHATIFVEHDIMVHIS